MRFAHYLGEFADDEGFMQAKYQASLQVERLKILENAREATRPPKSDEKRKDTSGNRQRKEETEKAEARPYRKGPYGLPGRWRTKEDDLQGVPPTEHEE